VKKKEKKDFQFIIDNDIFVNFAYRLKVELHSNFLHFQRISLQSLLYIIIIIIIIIIIFGVM
jgi:hypothetical protein